MPRPLLGLALGAFAIGTAELGVVGMLPQIAADLGITSSSAGLLVSAYAVGVVIGAPTLTVLGLRFHPRSTLMALLGVLVLGSVLSALAPSFGVLAATRGFTGLAHGAFFGVGSVVAHAVVPPSRRTRAVAVLFAGIASASIVGVPAGALIAEQTTWRLVFALCAVLGLLAAVGLAIWLPGIPHQPVRLRGEVRAFRRPQVWLLLSVTMVGLAATYAVYANITFLLTELGGVPTAWLTAVLVLFGIGTTLGTLLGGRLGDRFGVAVVAVGLPVLAAVLVLGALFARTPATVITAVVGVGAIAFAMNPVMQAQVIAAARVPGGSLVSAANQGAFNVANASGPAVASVALTAGHGVEAPLWVAAAFASAGALLASCAWALGRSAVAADIVPDVTADGTPVRGDGPRTS